MKKIRCIINPNSGSGRGKKMVEAMNRCLDKNLFTCEICSTEAPGHAILLCQEAVDKGCDIVVIAGGDGSVNEVGSVLVNTQTALGIIPCGSGNGFARHLGIPNSASSAIKIINKGYIKKVDTGSVNGKSFLSTAGVGFDAEVSLDFSKMGTRGLKSYIRAVFRKFPEYQAGVYHISTSEKSISNCAFLVNFANTSQYGNDAVIAPEASISDGLLDVCLIKSFPKTAIIELIWRLFNKNIHQSRYTSTFKVRELTLRHDSQLVHLDGDPYFLGNELQIKTHPLSLNVIVPENLIDRKHV